MSLPFEPQKAKAARDVDACLMAGSEATMEAKVDGWRLIATVDHSPEVAADGEGVQLYARTGTRLTDHLPHIVERLAETVPPGTWLDGEAATEDDDWGKIQSILGGYPKPRGQAEEARFFVFDAPRLMNEDLMAEELRARLRYLSKLFEGMGNEHVLPIPRFDATEDSYATLLSEGYEGAVVKRLESPYSPGKRGYGWDKLKARHSEDVVIMGFTEGNGELAGLIGSVRFGQFKDDALIERGSCSGMDRSMRRWITENQGDLLGAVIEIVHFGVGNDSGFRHPNWIRLREDKPQAECLWTS